MVKEYSCSYAEQFNWASLGDKLPLDRLKHLEKYLLGTKILEAGCGGGGYVRYLTRQGFDVTGFDFSEELLKSALSLAPNKFVCGDICHLPFRDKFFDSSFSIDVLEHVDDLTALTELVRVTRRRLLLCIPKEDDTELGKYGLTFYHYQDTTHLRYYNEKKLASLISAINPKSFQIIPEAYLYLDLFFRETSFIDKEFYGFIPLLEPFYKLKARSYRLNKLLYRSTAFILKRLLKVPSIDDFIERLYYEKVTYKLIPTSFLAVVDL